MGKIKKGAVLIVAAAATAGGLAQAEREPGFPIAIHDSGDKQPQGSQYENFPAIELG